MTGSWHEACAGGSHPATARSRALPRRTPGGPLTTPVYTRRVSTRVSEAIASSAGARRPRRADWRRRRPPKRTARSTPRPRSCSSGRRRSSRPTRSTSPRPKRPAWRPSPLDRLRLTEARLESMAARPAPGRGAPRPDRRGPRRLAPPERPRDPAGPGAAGRRRDHLREPTERHERRRRASASSRATPRCCGARRRRSTRTGRSPTRCEPGSPRPVSRPTPCCSSTTSRTRPPSRSCS